MYKNDYLGLADYGGCCQADVDRAVAEYADEIAEVKKAGTNCLSTIACGRCSREGSAAQYSPPKEGKPGSITICTRFAKRLLAHELQHAKNCKSPLCGNGNLAACKEVLCQEISAYICEHQGTGEDCDKTSNHFSYEKCRIRAWVSVGGRPGNTNVGVCPSCNRHIMGTTENEMNFIPPNVPMRCYEPKCVITRRPKK